MISTRRHIMPEQVDIVDIETGQIYEEDMLAACAYIWAVKNGWKVVEDEVDTLELDDEVKTVRWLYVKAVTQAARDMQFC
jgi:hypothetical protein